MSGFIIVRDIMAKNIKTVKPDDSVHSAVVKMNKFGIGSVIVISSGRPIGIITETNVMRRVVEQRMDPATVWAKDIMTSPLVTIDQTAAVEEAAKIMADKNISRLPVTNGSKLVGLISSTDIVRANPTQLGILDELLRLS
ncbi:CBS domain-containing protein [Candidatus Bathyarchaeota archaeon]|jgi:CBS domain-containing protein|nr:CBS domain-containing protein [Candidatus Bathyarchaeota archaeon]MBT4320074.1 CBS domain-containing protein [Candidatus Bathyarchaeota archaeon]MBT4424005.1 CBS domain-containing protein [Candidatus Bathyarchaeota archaeon]MBT5641820.1 CBS domain-containing protein [Candidatus Bathyarchaeota archaeon]MBT6605013.1 CBS domain-containing protein [Candidatus Bathyarchaeota archaeon]